MSVMRTLRGESALLGRRSADFRPQSLLSIADSFPQLCGLRCLPPSEWSTCTLLALWPLFWAPSSACRGSDYPWPFLKGTGSSNLCKRGM